MLKSRFELVGISRYRTELMGFATLLILACHATQYGVNMPPPNKLHPELGKLGSGVLLFLIGNRSFLFP